MRSIHPLPGIGHVPYMELDAEQFGAINAYTDALAEGRESSELQEAMRHALKDVAYECVEVTSDTLKREHRNALVDASSQLTAEEREALGDMPHLLLTFLPAVEPAVLADCASTGLLPRVVRTSPALCALVDGSYATTTLYHALALVRARLVQAGHVAAGTQREGTDVADLKFGVSIEAALKTAGDAGPITAFERDLAVHFLEDLISGDKSISDPTPPVGDIEGGTVPTPAWFYEWMAGLSADAALACDSLEDVTVPDRVGAAWVPRVLKAVVGQMARVVEGVVLFDVAQAVAEDPLLAGEPNDDLLRDAEIIQDDYATKALYFSTVRLFAVRPDLVSHKEAGLHTPALFYGDKCVTGDVEGEWRASDTTAAAFHAEINALSHAYGVEPVATTSHRPDHSLLLRAPHAASDMVQGSELPEFRECLIRHSAGAFLHPESGVLDG